MKFTLRSLIFTIIFFLGFSNVQSQITNPDGCGTVGMTEWFKWYVQNRDMLQAAEGGSDTNWLYVPVTLHLLGTDAGTGYFNTSLAIAAMNNMNQQYIPARIRFYLVPGDPFRYINNSAWYSHDWQDGADMIFANKIPNRLNAFVVQDPAGNCGYSWHDAIVLGKGCSSSTNTTWAHEAGHHFSLPHPFLGWEGESHDYNQPAPAAINGHDVEKTDGSNCQFAGDYFCDTPPDYLNYRWQCNSDGESTVLEHDPDGVSFRSDASLIMGYAYDACASRFSDEQIMAMRNNLNFDHNEYLQLSAPLQEISDATPVELISPIDTAFVQYNNFTLTWNPVPDASLYTVEVGLSEEMQPRLIWKTTYNSTTLSITQGIPNNKLVYWRVYPYSEWDLSKQLAEPQLGVFTTKNLLSTNELENVLQAELTPNPVLSGLPASLSLNTESAMDAQLTVSETSGRVCVSQQIKLEAGENNLHIPTEKLPAGLYIVTVQNELGSLTKRLAISN
jgi:hypothetical protein